MPRPGRLVWVSLWLLTVALVGHFLLITHQKYAVLDPASYGMFWSRRQWLWLHLACGATMALLGPLQFITRIRTRYPRFHRWTGRVYLLAMLGACVGVVGLIATTPAGFGIAAAFSATGLAWVCTAVPGFVSIRRGRVQVHRLWMLRNYIITLSPIVFRLAIQVPTLMAIAPPGKIIPVLLIMSWGLPLCILEAGRWSGRMRRSTQPLTASVA